MTSSIRTLVRRILIVLLVILLPAAAHSQEPVEPAQAGSSPAPEAQATEPAGQKSPQQQGDPARVSEISVPDQAAAVQEAAEGTYIIKQGDTLWDISSAFLRDPFLWPFIWKANPSITNADLIYPGNSLVIPSMTPIERALAAPAPASEQAAPADEPAPVAATAPAPREEPDGGLFGRKMPVRANGPVEEERVSKLLLPESMQLPLADKYTVLRAGFVGFDESKDRIIGIVGGEKTIFAYNDIVYVKMVSRQAAPGDKFLIFTPLHSVRHPTTRARYGKLIRVDGVLEIIAPGTGGNYSARIVLSFDTASPKSMLTPYQDPPLIYGNVPTKNKDIEGYVLDIRQDQTISSQFDCVYLDKGTADGVELGDRFVIYNTVKKGSYPNNKVGEAQVIVVKEKTATAVVNNSLNTLIVGDRFEYKK